MVLDKMELKGSEELYQLLGCLHTQLQNTYNKIKRLFFQQNVHRSETNLILLLKVLYSIIPKL